MADYVLVLGAGGFIGRALTWALAHNGIRVVAASSTPQPWAHPLVEAVVAPRPRDPDDFASLLSHATKVVHVATASTPASSMARPLQEVTGNLHVTAALLEALQEHPGKELLYLSSGGSLYADNQKHPSDENAPVRPRSYHGAAKLAAESFICAWCAQHSARATVLRPSNVYGPGQIEKIAFAVIPTALGKLRRGETFHVWGDGSAQRDYIFIDDLVRLCVSILTQPMPIGMRVLNACSGSSVDLNELLGVVESVTGIALHRTFDVARPVDASNISMDPRLAQETYGWRSQIGIEEGIRRTWAWLEQDRAE